MAQSLSKGSGPPVWPWTPDWPYDWNATEGRLDPRQIERQGAFLLSRALNIRRIIAFLGSGASIPYGRVSWSELATVQIARLTDLLENCEDIEIRRLCEQLQEFRAIQRELIADENILALQLCEQVWSLSQPGDLVRLCDAFDIEGIREDLERTLKQPELGRQLMRAWIKRETFDEIPHVRRILKGNLGGIAEGSKLANDLPWPLQGTKVKAVWEDVARSLDKRVADSHDTGGRPDSLTDLCRENAGRADRTYLKLFEEDNLRAIREQAGKRLPEAAALIDVLLDGQCISPVHYYILGLACDALRVAGRPEGAEQPAPDCGAGAAETHRSDDAAPPSGNRAGRQEERKTRSKIIDERHDPLRKLAFDLDIRRYLTTNYDLEVERLFVDYGFEPPRDSIGSFVSTKDSERVGPLGGRTRDIVLGEETTAELVDFAVHESDYAFQVVHLHGRATDDADIVITERDYQRKYLRDGRYQQVFKEGLDLAFGGNPILFVGLGLSEGDVMRPMREFTAGLSRRNRSLIALRPANANRMRSNLFTMQQYSRHGVHVIHFGFETTGAKDVNAPAAESSWLGTLVDAEEGTIARLRQAIRQGSGSDIATAWGDLVQGLPRGMLKKELSGVFQSDYGDCDIGRDLKAIQTIVGLAKAAPELKEDVLPVALDRARASILTSALCAKLDGVKRGWQEWWETWQRIPTSRETKAVYEQDGADASAHHRYLIVEPEFRDGCPQAEDDPMRAPSAQAHVDIIDCLVWQEHARRRTFVVPGERGSGKGFVFAGLRERYRHWKREKRYRGSFFVTLSLSNEIASVWDQLIRFLQNPERLIGAAPTPRVDALRRTLQSPAAGRVLVVLNAFDALLDRDGTPKTAEIRDMLDLLLGEAGQSYPMDLVLLVRTSRLPCYFRKNEAPPSRAASPASAPACGPRSSVPSRVLRLASTPVHPCQPCKDADYGPLRRLVGAGAAVSKAGVPPEVAGTLGLVETEAANSCYAICPLAPRSDAETQLNRLATGAQYRGLRPWLQHNEATARQLDAGGLSDWNKVQEQIAALLAGAHPRFQVMLVLNVVFDITRRNTDGADCSPAWPRIRRFLAELEHFAGRIGGSDGESHNAERLVQLVFDHWFQEALAAGRSDEAALTEHIVRHLAVIGMPVRTDVLLDCPLIREAVGNNGTDVVRSLLEELARRGLIFKIRPRHGDAPPGDAETPGGAEAASANWRWTVHRSIQHYVYRRLGAQRVEPADNFLFAPSLYATQIRGHVQLNARAYAFIYDLVDHLARYPGRVPLKFATPQDPGAAEVGKLFEGLRAAVGVIRTLFSIGVVSRFDDLDGLDFQLPPKLGYFEHHRLVVRWMVRLAGTLQEKLKVCEELWAPFYRDELVWLYNECGVFSLAQGEIYDAHALLSMAARINRGIEGRNGGAIARRLLLNRSICSIERGRLNEAEEGFQKIVGCNEEEDLLKEVARGYLGLVHHIKGRVEIAEQLYERAIKRLVDMERFRPVSILRRHNGDMKRLLARYDEAEREYEAAERVATAGGNMDLVHMAQVAMARLRLWHGGVDEITRKMLDDATGYADVMELPRLKAEALFARAEALLSGGETTLAADFVARALRIATLNGLALRKAAYSELMARIYEARGDRRAAAILQAQTIKAARGQGYNVLVNRIAAASHETMSSMPPTPAPSTGRWPRGPGHAPSGNSGMVSRG